MANNSVPASSQNKEYCVKFYHLWCKKFKFIQKSWRGEGFVLRTVCGSDFSMAYGGKNDINRLGRRKYPFKHMGYVYAVQRQRKLTDFVEQKIFAAGCLCHLAHLRAGKGDNKLSVNVENFVIDINHNFRRSAKLKK